MGFNDEQDTVPHYAVYLQVTQPLKLSRKMSSLVVPCNAEALRHLNIPMFIAR